MYLITLPGEKMSMLTTHLTIEREGKAGTGSEDRGLNTSAY